jgi:DNA-binding LacI/PurR family transcriptional regulator
LTAFKELKAKGIISSISGKGYYLESVRIDNSERIFLLFDELNSFKEDIYTAFMEGIKTEVEVDIYFHHFNMKTFSNLIRESVGKYTSYIIMPGTFSNLIDELKNLPAENTYILDRKKNLVSNKYTTIYQNFHKGTLHALESADVLFNKYNKIVMIYPGGKEPVERKNALVSFCESKGLELEIFSSYEEITVEKGVAYFVHSDRNLVRLVKTINEKQLKLADEVGIVSFNDTELKEVVANGITTISTDFKEMGRELAKSITNKSKESIEIPTKMIVRQSL